MLRLFILSFVVSLCTGFAILRWQHLHTRFSRDVALPGSHKVHATSVPRIGGVAVFIGWIVSLAVSSYYKNIAFETILIWMGCLLPTFLAGLTEDLTKRVSPRTRLLFSFLSAGLAYVFLGAIVDRLDIGRFDTLLAIPAVSFLFTLVAVGGIAHAVNIIDGLNGLASSVCLMAFLALGYVAFNVHDQEVLLMCGLGVGALLGLHVLNYPSGQIFCGDGGAYFLGSYIAILSALLVSRNATVSAWFPFLLVVYPVWETLFSAYRRRVMRGLPATAPDKLHLHTLVYKRLRHGLSLKPNGWHSRRNSDASVLMVMFAGAGALPAVLWWQDGVGLFIWAVAFVVVYLVIYRRLVRFGFRGKHKKVPDPDIAETEATG